MCEMEGDDYEQVCLSMTMTERAAQKQHYDYDRKLREAEVTISGSVTYHFE